MAISPNMPVGFHATQCTVTDEYGVLISTLGAPSAVADDFYLMLQYKPVCDDQDKKFGMDKPYIEYCGQGWSWYGHIVSFRLARDHVQVQMDDEAALHMRNDGQIEVTFSLGDTEFNALRAALQTTFTGCTYYVDTA
jgi:Immunity protein 10